MGAILSMMGDRVTTGLRAGAVAIAVALIAAVLVLSGLGFVVAGVWLALAPVWGPAAASFALGAGLLAFGAIVMMVSAIRRPVTPPPIRQEVPVAALIEAFMTGMGAGRAARGRDKP